MAACASRESTRMGMSSSDELLLGFCNATLLFARPMHSVTGSQVIVILVTEILVAGLWYLDFTLTQPP